MYNLIKKLNFNLISYQKLLIRLILDIILYQMMITFIRDNLILIKIKF